MPYWKVEHTTSRTMVRSLVVAEHWEDDPDHTTYRDPTYGDLSEAQLVPALDHQATVDKLERVIAAGHLLANAAYNVKQLKALGDDVRRSLGEAQERWDAAVRL